MWPCGCDCGRRGCADVRLCGCAAVWLSGWVGMVLLGCGAVVLWAVRLWCFAVLPCGCCVAGSERSLQALRMCGGAAVCPVQLCGCVDGVTVALCGSEAVAVAVAVAVAGAANQDIITKYKKFQKRPPSRKLKQRRLLVNSSSTPRIFR